MRNSSVKPTVFLSAITASLLLSACGGGDAPLPDAQPMPLLSAEQTIPAAEAAIVHNMIQGAELVDPATTGIVTTTEGGGGSLRKSKVSIVNVPVAPLNTTTSSVSVTDIKLESLSSVEQVSVPLSFGQVFAAGHVSASQTVVGQMPDGSTLPLQVDVKARHPDGSVRHAILSALIPSLGAGAKNTIGLNAAPAGVSALQTSATELLGSNFTAAAHVTISGLRYSASADQLLRSGRMSTWLSGPVVSEWHVSAPLTTADGVAHPHLTARFAIRSYHGQSKARVDVTIENAWAYQAAPQAFVYDAQIEVGGNTVYSKAAMTHYDHARWRKVFWWGGEPQVHIRHNTAYLIGSRALPNYDRSITFPEMTLAALKNSWTGAKTEPMGVGLANNYMPATGGRNDIGLLPGWAATYLLSMDKRAKDVTLGTADLAGSWSAHFRNKNTDRPVTLTDFPYMTILGNPGDTLNPKTKLREAFPVCAATACPRVNSHDSSHQPGFAYLPYLVTGDYYYLEELQFWASWNTFSGNPGYRENIKGLLKTDQVRGQAWSLRTLAQAAYITPDSDPLKANFSNIMASNLDWYNANYTNNPTANNLGILSHGYAIVYNTNTGIAPWMDDFFTSAVGYANELGFTAYKPLLDWKAKFPVARMIDPGACWIEAGIYSLKVRDSATAPLYTSYSQAFKASHTEAFNLLECNSVAMQLALKMRAGEMTGYSSTVTGYPSNLQPALAYAASEGSANALQAWTKFMSRSIKPDYSAGPQFAIVPR